MLRGRRGNRSGIRGGEIGCRLLGSRSRGGLEVCAGGVLAIICAGADIDRAVTMVLGTEYVKGRR